MAEELEKVSPLKLSPLEAGRLFCAVEGGEYLAEKQGRKVWTEEMELNIVGLLKDGKSACSIIREEHVSGRKLNQIRKKYKLWGA